MNVDAADADDPATVIDYVNDIYAHFRSVEVRGQRLYCARTGAPLSSPINRSTPPRHPTPPVHPALPLFHAPQATSFASPTYMKNQADINEKMRAILIDWLVEVHLKFKLMPETMYLTVNIIDRFLEKKQVIRQKLQLVGVTAMLLASKYEEIYAPEVRDFVYITDKAYTKEQILQMEATMLNTLEFRITVPTAYVFTNRFLKVAGAAADAKVSHFATFLAERMLQEAKVLNYTPSMMAAATVNVALRTVRGRAGAWDRKLELYSGYTQDALRACIKDVEELIANPANTLKAVSKKYALPKFSEVSTLVITPLE